MAHPCHEFPRIRARIGGELVAGMAQVVNVDAFQADHSMPQLRRSTLGTPIRSQDNLDARGSSALGVRATDGLGVQVCVQVGGSVSAHG